jgi:squalene-hopene/tetraprenyl-beta-curcumene cyclase
MKRMHSSIVITALAISAACAFAAQRPPSTDKPVRSMPIQEENHGVIAAPGQLPRAQLPDKPTERVQYLIDRGLFYLKKQQKPDGSWQNAGDQPALTALVLRAFARNPQADGPFLKKGFDKLLSYQKPNGGIYHDMLANYNTAIAVSLLAEIKNADYQPQLDKAMQFLKRLQWSDQPAEGAPDRAAVNETDPRFGGWGYGRHERPDLSNAQFAIEALHDAGLKPSDPAYKAALVFLSRTQNNSETNDQPWSGDDGGFVYTPADGGDSEAKTLVAPDGRKIVRSYGSMTYAGLKSMIYAGLSKDDPRVKAAMGWIAKHWTLDENPAMRDASPDLAQHGLYYYYYVFAHALDAYDEPVIADTQGAKHDWRLELIDKMASLQRPDGSWVGEKRWMEDNPVLATAYVVLALQEAQKDLREHAGKSE